MTKLIYDRYNERFVIETSDRKEHHPTMLSAIKALDEIFPSWNHSQIDLTELDFRSHKKCESQNTR